MPAARRTSVPESEYVWQVDDHRAGLGACWRGSGFDRLTGALDTLASDKTHIQYLPVRLRGVSSGVARSISRCGIFSLKLAGGLERGGA